MVSADEPASVSPFRYGASPVPVPSRRIEGRADVVVIGAGNLGLSTAITLSRAGRQVTVFEQFGVGEGASANGPGWLRAGRPQIEVADRVERPLRPAVSAAYAEAFDWTQDLISVFDIACGVELLGDDVGVDPFALNQGLLRVALEHEVTVHERAKVLRLPPAVGPGPGRTEVRTSRGRVRAQTVVIAAGVETNQLLGRKPGSRRARRYQYLSTDPVSSDHVARRWPSDRVTVEGELLCRPLGGHRYLFSAPGRRDLLDRLSRVSPEIRPTDITHRWTVDHLITSDGIARAGRSGELWWAVSGSPDDLATEGWLGAQLGRWVDGEEPPIHARLAKPRPKVFSLW